MPSAIYDRIGVGYVSGRQADPRWQAAIDRVLGSAQTVLNVGAGTGSYEPADRRVLALEPSPVMLAQRPPNASPAVQGTAENLPFADAAFDVALAISTLHHWNDWRAGINEMRRVAARVVVLHFDPAVHDEFWLVRDYLPQMSDVWRDTPTPQQVTAQVGPDASIQALPIPWDFSDGLLQAYWRRPTAYLDPDVRQCMSSFHLLEQADVEQAMSKLDADLHSGRWQSRQQELMARREHDGGWRLIFN
jgi:SAM-dependent methyltransferase